MQISNSFGKIKVNSFSVEACLIIRECKPKHHAGFQVRPYPADGQA
jgi:hypothetical protein